MNFLKNIIAAMLIFIALPACANHLPENFVYLSDIEPSIIQDMRYAGSHNFIGRPIKGYEAGECILTRPAAAALSAVQADLKKSGYSLKVYDCYRPQKAVDDFIAWSKQPAHQEMKAEFYPRVNKVDFFKLGYVAEKSGHTRGSTVDITIVPIPTPKQAMYLPKQRLTACFNDYKKRFHDNSIDMATGYDCMDELSHSDNQDINKSAYKNRQLLYWMMEKHGYVNLPTEWWHFTLKREPYKSEYFNFNVQSKFPITLVIPPQSRQLLVVRANTVNATKAEMQRYERRTNKHAWIAVGNTVPTVIGKNGLALLSKKEGDLATPSGVFAIEKVFGFEKNDVVHMPYEQLTDASVCVDDPHSHFYNQIVNEANIANPDWHSAEKMRQVPVYKMGAVVLYNRTNTPGLGSCIFMHIWQNPDIGTAGCIAMAEPVLKEILSWLEAAKRPVIVIFLNS